MVTTVIVKIRAILDDFFESMDMTTRLNEYLCPKILRLFEIIGLFRNKNDDDLSIKEMPKNEMLVESQDECLLEPEVELNLAQKISYILPKSKRIVQSEHYRPHEWDPNALCGLILVDNDFTARLLFYLFNVRIICGFKKFQQLICKSFLGFETMRREIRIRESAFYTSNVWRSC